MRRWFVGVLVLCCLAALSGLAGAAGSIALHDSGLIPVGGLVGDILPDPNRPVLYVTDYTNGKVLAYRVPTGELLASVPVGAGPRSLALDPSGTLLYVAEEWTYSIGVINLKTGRRAAAMPVGTRPYSIAAGRQGRLYVATVTEPPGWSPYGDLRIFDTTTGAMIGPFFPWGFYEPKVAMSRDNATLYVLLRGLSPGYLDAIDVTTDTPKVTAGIYTDSYLNDLWVNQRGDRLYADSTVYSLPSLTGLGDINYQVQAVTTALQDRYVLTGYAWDPNVQVWDAELLTPVGTIPLPGGTNLLRFSERKRAVCTTPGGENIEMYW